MVETSCSSDSFMYEMRICNDSFATSGFDGMVHLSIYDQDPTVIENLLPIDTFILLLDLAIGACTTVRVGGVVSDTERLYFILNDNGDGFPPTPFLDNLFFAATGLYECNYLNNIQYADCRKREISINKTVLDDLERISQDQFCISFRIEVNCEGEDCSGVVYDVNDLFQFSEAVDVLSIQVTTNANSQGTIQHGSFNGMTSTLLVSQESFDTELKDVFDMRVCMTIDLDQLVDNSENNDCNFSNDVMYGFTGLTNVATASYQDVITVDTICTPIDPCLDLALSCRDTSIDCYRDTASGSLLLPQVTESCCAIAEMSYKDSIASINCETEFVIHRRWHIMDSCFNESFCTQVITLVDNDAPIPMVDSIVEEIDCYIQIPMTPPAIQVDTTCELSTMWSFTAFTFDSVCPYDFSRQFVQIVTDDCQQSDTVIRTYLVSNDDQVSFDREDEQIPTLCPNDLNIGYPIVPIRPLDCALAYQVDTFEEKFSSNCAVELSSRFVFILNDACHHTDSLVIEYIVTDDEAPEIIWPHPDTFSDMDISQILDNLTVTDNCDVHTTDIRIDSMRYEDCPDYVVYQVAIHASDRCGSKRTYEATIIQVIRGDLSIFIPSAFSPNNDGINDHWILFSNGCNISIENLKIYNRWGGLVYENVYPETNLSDHVLWDGRAFSKISTPETYIYLIQVKDVHNRTYSLSGDITILK